MRSGDPAPERASVSSAFWNFDELSGPGEAAARFFRATLPALFITFAEKSASTQAECGFAQLSELSRIYRVFHFFRCHPEAQPKDLLQQCRTENVGCAALQPRIRVPTYNRRGAFLSA